MTSAVRLWFIGGWGFVVFFLACLALLTVLALRERRRAVEHARPLDASELDQYERALLEGEDLAATRLAVVNLLHRGVLAPGTHWKRRNPSYGEPLFSLEVRDELGADAHPLERAVCDRVAELGPLSAEKLFKHLAEGEPVARMHARLLDAGLLHRKQGAWLFHAQFALFVSPWIAFFAFCFTWDDGGVVVGIPEALVNFAALIVVPYLAFAVPNAAGATALGEAAYEAGARPAPAEPRTGESRNREVAAVLVDAYDRRFIGL